MLLLLLSQPAWARVDDVGSPPGGVIDAEAIGVALALIIVGVKLIGHWLAREALDEERALARMQGVEPEADVPWPMHIALRAVGLPLPPPSGGGGGRHITAASVFGTSAPRLTSDREEEDPDAAATLSRRLPDLSVPLVTELVVELYRGLLVQRGQGTLGRYDPLVLPGAREALLNLAGVQAVDAVSVGPARLVAASVPERIALVDVELFALVEERWQDQRRVRLRKDRLRLHRALDAPHVPHSEALATLLDPTRDLLLPADVDGWILASQLSDMVQPPTLAALRETDGEHATIAGRPRRSRDPDLHAELRAFSGRHPDSDAEALRALVEDLAPRSLRARLPGAQPDAALTAVLSHRIAALHAFWRRAAELVELPALELSTADDFRAARCQVAEVRPLRVGLDPWCELIDYGVQVEGSTAPDAGTSPHRHLEVWTLARQVGTDHPWRLVDLSWAPPALA